MPLVPTTVSVTVMVVGLPRATDADEISWPEAKVMFGGAEVLNWNPAGAFKTKVTFEPAPKSDLLLSLITIGPRIVHAGAVALAALSARMLVPPVAGVRVTVASAQFPNTNAYRAASGKIIRPAQDGRSEVRRVTCWE